MSISSRLGRGAIALAVALWSQSVWAIDCSSVRSPVDRTICQSRDLLLLEHQINSLVALRNAQAELPSASNVLQQQAAWTNRRDADCATATEDCLAELGTKRFEELIRAGPGTYSGFDIRFGTLSIKVASLEASSRNLYVGPTRLLDGVLGAELSAGLHTDGIDAVVVKLSRGGFDTYTCNKEPLYLLTQRAGQPAEAVKISPDLGYARGASCPVWIERSATGFIFTVEPQPFFDGARFTWSPQAGLSERRVLTFVPLQGPSVAELFVAAAAQAFWTLGAEEAKAFVYYGSFHDALRQFADTTRTSFPMLADAFGGVTELGFARFGPVGVLRACPMPNDINGYRPFSQGRCHSPFQPTALFHTDLNRLFLVLAEDRDPPSCNDGPDRLLGRLATAKYVPPLAEWPNEVLDALRQSYCQQK